MEKNNSLNKIKIIGKFCNFISVIYTMLLCVPMPIIFLFIIKESKTYFSILNTFEKYLNKNVSLETLKKHNRNVIIRLSVLSIIFTLLSWLMFTENTSSDFEMRGNFIFSFTAFVLTSTCYYLSYMVYKFTENFEVLKEDKCDNVEEDKSVTKLMKNKDRSQNSIKKKALRQIAEIFSLKKRKFSRDEKIIISIMIGVICLLVFGNIFGVYSNIYDGRIVNEYFKFNYLIGISSFILGSGTSYLFLNSGNKKN